MRRNIRRGALAVVTVVLAFGCRRSAEPAPVVTADWVRPGAEPVWGRAGGLGVGVWPTSGPRGLIRIYSPYLGQPHPRMLTYVAVEPVISGARGQSELEPGPDGKPGLPMTTGDTPAEAVAGDPKALARGRLEVVDGVEVLTFWLATGPFRNGARPLIQVILRADRPYEVGFRVQSAPGGTPMDSCVLTATMGNYARLRRLWLRGEVIEAGRLWPKFDPDPLGFTPWRAWGRDRLLKVGNDLIAAADSDEADPAGAKYDPKVPAHWRYAGRPATQYWRTADVPGAVVRVNGRTTYWGDQGPIPGGISYENFELEAPFAADQEFWFGATPDGPASLGFDPVWAERRVKQ